MGGIQAFWDLENLAESSRRQSGREFSVEEGLRASGGWRQLVGIRAYADYRNVPDGLVRSLQAHDVDLIHVLGRTRDGVLRDAADFRLTNDLIEAVVSRPDITRIVLGSGDRAFVPALARARRAGKEIRILSVEGSLSRDLAAIAPDQVILLTGGRVLARRPEIPLPSELKVADTGNLTLAPTLR